MAEHAVDLETGAVVGVSVQDADAGDTATMIETLVTLAALGMRSYVSEKAILPQPASPGR